MTKEPPAWAMRIATPDDHADVKEAQERGRVQIHWPDPKSLRTWAKQHNWPTPWFSFQDAFLTHMLANPENFALALKETGLTIHLPQTQHTITPEELQALDALYAERGESGRPTSWGILVEELREIRRAMEAGVVIDVAGTTKFRSFQGFYDWAHGRYHMLEDGYDSWIGDDNS